MHSRGKRPTKLEIARWSRFPGIGCLACRQLGHYSLPEVHHLTDRGRRRGHRYTIPLCPAHHRGVGFVLETHKASVAASALNFRNEFGANDFLLNLADQLVEEAEDIAAGRKRA